MSDKEILEKAIQKAFDNGWEDSDLIFSTVKKFARSFRPELYIFNHDFAKALWPENRSLLVRYERKGTVELSRTLPLWQFHLHEMVIANDPIEYIGENI